MEFSGLDIIMEGGWDWGSAAVSRADFNWHGGELGVWKGGLWWDVMDVVNGIWDEIGTLWRVFIGQ